MTHSHHIISRVFNLEHTLINLEHNFVLVILVIWSVNLRHITFRAKSDDQQQIKKIIDEDHKIQEGHINKRVK